MLYKRKSIVLLITLFFITAISTLILKNLNDSDQFIEVSETTYRLTQMNMVLKDVKQEIIDLFNQNKDNDNFDIFLSYISAQSIPLIYPNGNLNIEIQKIDKSNLYYINYLGKEYNATIYNNFKKYINATNSIKYIDEFRRIVKENNISNQRQLDFVIDKYIDNTKDIKILDIKDVFTYYKLKDINDSDDYDIISLKCDITVEGLESYINIILKDGSEGFRIKKHDFYIKSNLY